nr:hypothetical protein [Tanacetum cinerariifolium]
MSSPDHSTSNNEDAFSSNISDYISTILDYSLASSGKTYSNASIGKITPEFSHFYNMKDIQAFYAKKLPIPLSFILPPSLVLSQSPISDFQDFFPSEKISPKDTETSVSPSSSVGSSSPIRSTISPLDYPFDESIFTELDNSLWITPRPMGEEPVSEELNEFLELVLSCPNMVPNSEKLIEAFIGGLPRSIEGDVTASKPQTLKEAINIAQRLMDQIIKHNSTQDTNDHKRKFDDTNNTDNNNYPNDRNNNYQNNHNKHNHNNDHHQQQNKKQETFKTYVATNGYTGNRPLCERCTLHHIGPCSVKFQNFNWVGHLTKNCRNKIPIIGNNLRPIPVTCNACEEKGHYANKCSKANNRAT